MTSLHRPKLRSYLAATPIDPHKCNGKEFVLHDRLRLSSMQIPLSRVELDCLRLFDGNHTLAEIHQYVMVVLGQLIPFETVVRLMELLDRSLFLQSPLFLEAVGGSIRKPCCLGVYPAEADELRDQLTLMFQAPDASGLPREPATENRLRAILAPHIDYQRGGFAYTYAFKELFEKTTASLFVIIGTSHYCGWRRFTLTRKNFQTPLGIAPTDQTYVDRLVEHYGDGLFDEEWIAHLPEHSIELEVVLLHYLYEKRRDLRIVPIVVGSFQDCIETNQQPSERDDLRRMIAALRAVEQETNEPMCYVISGDLAHIGPKFGAEEPIGDAQLTHSRLQDLATLARAEKVDERGYFEIIRRERDERNVCGLSPTWLTLAASKPSHGRLLKYGQYVEPSGHESVSFASMAFYC